MHFGGFVARDKGQNLIQYAILLALIVSIGAFIYMNLSGFTQSVGTVYDNAQSLLEEAGGNSSEPPQQSIDDQNAQLLAQALKNAVNTGRITLGDGALVEVAVVRHTDGTFGVDGGASGNVKIDGRNYRNYKELWGNIINTSGIGITSDNVTVDNDKTQWYGVRLDSNGHAVYYEATTDNPSFVKIGSRTEILHFPEDIALSDFIILACIAL